MKDFMFFELILGVATIILAPLVGRAIDSAILLFGQRRQNRKATIVYDNIEELISMPPSRIPPSLLRKVEVAWFKADNQLDHNHKMDSDLRARCRDSLTEAKKKIDEASTTTTDLVV